MLALLCTLHLVFNTIHITRANLPWIPLGPLDPSETLVGAVIWCLVVAACCCAIRQEVAPELAARLGRKCLQPTTNPPSQWPLALDHPTALMPPLAATSGVLLCKKQPLTVMGVEFFLGPKKPNHLYPTYKGWPYTSLLWTGY